MPRMSKEAKQTIDELWERNIDVSDRVDEIEQIIESIGRDFDPDRHWQDVYNELYGEPDR